MYVLNVRHEKRELRPDGYSVGNRVVLAGAQIFNGQGDYLGYWHEREMPRAVKRELLHELTSNWVPGFVDAQDW